MTAHACLKYSPYHIRENDLFTKLQSELSSRYSIDERLAGEMACDLIEVLAAVDGNVDIFEKYFLH